MSVVGAYLGAKAARLRRMFGIPAKQFAEFVAMMRRCDQIQQISRRVYEMLFGEKQVRRSCYGDAAQALKAV